MIPDSNTHLTALHANAIAAGVGAVNSESSCVPMSGSSCRWCTTCSCGPRQIGAWICCNEVQSSCLLGDRFGRDHMCQPIQNSGIAFVPGGMVVFNKHQWVMSLKTAYAASFFVVFLGSRTL